MKRCDNAVFFDPSVITGAIAGLFASELVQKRNTGEDEMPPVEYPEGYYIDDPLEKLPEVCGVLDRLGCKYEIRRDDAPNAPEFYDPSSNEEYGVYACVIVQNLYSSDRSIQIDFYDEITLLFDHWHGHYHTEPDFSELPELIEKIVKNEVCVGTVYLGSELNWSRSALILTREINERTIADIFAMHMPPKKFKHMLKKDGTEIWYRFWNEELDKKVTIERKGSV